MQGILRKILELFSGSLSNPNVTVFVIVSFKIKKTSWVILAKQPKSSLILNYNGITKVRRIFEDIQ